MPASQRIADLRTTISTPLEADAIFARIAMAEKKIAVSSACLDMRIAKLTDRHTRRIAPLVAIRDQYVANLSAYIAANPAQFKKPRTRKTEFGEYGMRSVADLRITNEHELLSDLIDRGYNDCYRVCRKPIKAALKKRLAQGKTLAGCSLRTGDTAVCKVSKVFLDEARRQATIES